MPAETRRLIAVDAPRRAAGAAKLSTGRDVEIGSPGIRSTGLRHGPVKVALCACPSQSKKNWCLHAGMGCCRQPGARVGDGAKGAKRGRSAADQRLDGG